MHPKLRLKNYLMERVKGKEGLKANKNENPLAKPETKIRSQLHRLYLLHETPIWLSRFWMLTCGEPPE